MAAWKWGSNSGYSVATVNAGASDGSVAVNMLSNGGAPFAGIVFRVVNADSRAAAPLCG